MLTFSPLIYLHFCAFQCGNLTLLDTQASNPGGVCHFSMLKQGVLFKRKDLHNKQLY